MRTISKTLLVAALLGASAPALAAAPTKAKAPGAGAAASAAPAAAASGVTGDVRCLLTMAALASNKERQQAGQVGIYYFAGRISARAPGFDLASALKAQAPTMGQKEFNDEFKRCGAMVGASSQSVQAALISLRPPGPPPGAAPAAPGPSAVKPAPTPGPAPAPVGAPPPTQIPK